MDQKTSQWVMWPFASCSAPQILHIELIRLLIVACGMSSHSSSMAVRSRCGDIGGYWNMLLYTSIQSIPNKLNGWHVWWVCKPWKNWDIFSIQELCTDTYDMGPCIIVLNNSERPFIVPSTRCPCVMIMVFNQLLDMPHLSGGWIILAKEKWSVTGR